MEGRHGATAPSLFRRGRGGGKPDSRGREKTAHGATFTEPPNPRSRIRSRRFADESECARHRIDRRRARLSRSCAVGAYSGGGSRGGSAARRATGQTDFCHGLPNRGWKEFGCRLPPASCGTSCSISKSGFRATTRQSWPTTSSVASLISLSSAGNQNPDLEYKLVAREPLLVFLPSDHRLAGHKAIDPHDLVGETFIGISEIPRVLRAVVSDYLKRTGIELTPHLEIDNFAMALSAVASTRGVALLPATAANFLTWSVVSRPLKGEAPTIDLVVGYHKANTSPILRTFLSRIDELTTRISSKVRDRRT